MVFHTVVWINPYTSTCPTWLTLIMSPAWPKFEYWLSELSELITLTLLGNGLESITSLVLWNTMSSWILSVNRKRYSTKVCRPAWRPKKLLSFFWLWSKLCKDLLCTSFKNSTNHVCKIFDVNLSSSHFYQYIRSYYSSLVIARSLIYPPHYFPYEWFA